MSDKAIELLAAKLGTTAEYLWAVLLKQAPVQMALDAVSALLMISIAACLVMYLRFAYREMRDDDMTIHVLGATFAAIGAVVLLIGAYSELASAITAAVNPEFWALDQVLRAGRK